jgi:sugar-phosphatase
MDAPGGYNGMIILLEGPALMPISLPAQFECEALLFDLDGVLIDSWTAILRHWTEWANKHGLDINEIVRIAHGLRSIETMRAVAPHLDLEKELEEFNAHELLDTEGVKAIEGAQELLSSLPQDAWAVVTSATLELAKVRLKAVGLPLPGTWVTAEDVKRGKPDPEPYLTGAQRLGFSPQDCIVVEDAPSGVRAGKSAGMRVIGVATTHTHEELLEQGVDLVVDRLAELRLQGSLDGHRLVIRVG